jgi:hypothetical protein
MRAAFIYLVAVGIFVAGGYAGLDRLANPSKTAGDVVSRPQPPATTSNETMPSKPARAAQERFSNASATLGQSDASHEANNAKANIRTRGDEGLNENESTVAPSSAEQPAGSDQSKATGSVSDQAAHDAPVGGCMPIGVTAGGALVFPLQCRELLEQHRGPYPAPQARAELTPAAPTEQVNHDLQTVDTVRDQQVFLSSTGSEVDPTPRARVKAAIDESRMIGENGDRQGKVLQSSRTRNDRHSHERFARLLKNPLALNCIVCLILGP